VGDPGALLDDLRAEIGLPRTSHDR
jgi:hypothetical protein